MKRIFCWAGLFLLVGCAQQPEQKADVNVSEYLYQVHATQVKNGMSEAQVVAIMGDNPSSRSDMEMPKGTIKVLGWSHYNAVTHKAYVVNFQLVDDKVIGRTEAGL